MPPTPKVVLKDATAAQIKGMYLRAADLQRQADAAFAVLDEKLAGLYESGATHGQLAEATGISRSNVQRRVQRHIDTRQG
ncbi:MAG: winged helix-turn-helix domain-containing protein [Phycisphaerales bacterium]